MHLISIALRKWDEFAGAFVTFAMQSSTELWVTVTGAGHRLMPYDIGHDSGVTARDRSPLSEL